MMDIFKILQYFSFIFLLTLQRIKSSNLIDNLGLLFFVLIAMTVFVLIIALIKLLSKKF